MPRFSTTLSGHYFMFITRLVTSSLRYSLFSNYDGNKIVSERDDRVAIFFLEVTNYWTIQSSYDLCSHLKLDSRSSKYTCMSIQQWSNLTHQAIKHVWRWAIMHTCWKVPFQVYLSLLFLMLAFYSSDPVFQATTRILIKQSVGLKRIIKGKTEE